MTVTLEEKRLKQLKQQLFGKEQPVIIKPSGKQKNEAAFGLNTKHASSTTVINATSLRTDLIKIISFSSLALAIQLLLFFVHKQGLINFFN